MCLKVCFIILIVVIVTIATSLPTYEDKRCPGKYQCYTTCLDLCPPICPNKRRSRSCPSVSEYCRAGCQCIQGYLLSNGTCVAPEDCPPFKCEELNEVYSRCGEKCTKTCASVLKKEPPECRNNTQCFPECICKKGYVRSRMLRCVLQKNCGSCKDPHEDYLECGPSYEATCQSPNPVNSPVCKIGCFCQPGYIRNDRKCIPYQDCPNFQ